MHHGAGLFDAEYSAACLLQDKILLTFHRILEGCESGDSEAWRAFLGDYSPLMLQLARLYPRAQSDPVVLWREAIISLCADNFELLRSFEHQSEREFLAGLRGFFLERGLAKVSTVHRPEGAFGPDPESLRELVGDLPLLHQELVFLTLAGYSDRTLEQMFRVAPAVGQKALERLEGKYGPFARGQNDLCPWPEAWLKLVRDLRLAKTDSCPSWRLFLRIQDGQVGWYDKEPAEKHLAQCLHCLEAWTGLREISYWRVAAPPASSQALDGLFSVVPARQGASEAVPFFKHILSRFGSSRRI
ncbi:MAG TPA: hypothetical protein VMI06_02010 [Terriglobia bacterium]|nr:hypothetical protein [Terriglobia bacterium]